MPPSRASSAFSIAALARRASYQGFFTPPEADRHSIQYPGYYGGTDWGGIAVDPQRGGICAGGHHFMETPIGDEVVAYALPG